MSKQMSFKEILERRKREREGVEAALRAPQGFLFPNPSSSSSSPAAAIGSSPQPDTHWELVDNAHPFRIFVGDGFTLAARKQQERDAQRSSIRGKMIHTEPPWRTCALLEDNEEHPMYLPWMEDVPWLNGQSKPRRVSVIAREVMERRKQSEHRDSAAAGERSEESVDNSQKPST